MLSHHKISNHITLLKHKDPELKIFDVVMETKFGTSYNAYLLNGGEELALVDSAKHHFSEETIEHLNELTDNDLKKIKYIIVNHTEPDHSGEIEEILKIIPHVKIVGTPSALGFLKDISNSEYESIEVKEGSSLKIGSITLDFIIAPNLHWPDSMFTYVREDKVLLTCDVFGAHYCADDLFSDQINKEEFDEAFKYYYDCIFGPFAEDVISGIKKIEGLTIDVIGTSHGPLHKEEMINEVKQKYSSWSITPKIEEDKISILYTTAYGYTQTMAQTIGESIKKQGFKVQYLDALTMPEHKVLHEINTSSAFLVGSPTINADSLPPITNILHKLSPKTCQNKLSAAFGSFGWSGEAIRNTESRLSQLKTEVVRPGLKIKFNPNSYAKIKQCRVFGEDFAKRVLTLRKKKNTDWAQLKTGKWKCLVCGEIFSGEYPPEECPTCGAPADQFIEVIDEEISFSSMKRQKIVIVGAGIASISAIESIRKRNPVAEIMLFSEEDELPYYRILLSKKLCQSEVECTLKDKQWFEENNIELKLGEEVQSINKETKKISTKTGEYYYDSLLLATGARANIFSIYGDDKEGVFSLRNKGDFNRINSYVQKPHVNEIVIIGGGILGIEMACSLKRIGKEVTVVEFAPRIMSRQLDPEGSELFEAFLKERGIKLLTSETIEEIYGTGEGYKEVSGVKLQHAGDKIPAQMVIRNTGVKANIELANDSGLQTHRGILVDETMKTSDENIYAAGDVVEFESKNIGLWSIALEQGRVAGAQIVGDTTQTYYQRPIATSFSELGYSMFSIGDIGLDQECRQYQILELKDPKNQSYRKFYFLDNQFVGGILIGDCKKAAHLRKALDRGSNLQTFLDAHFLDE